jgi:hypothetical protein
MTLEEIKRQNTLVAERHIVIKELLNYLHDIQFNRTIPTSNMLKELRDKIDEMLKNDF